MENFPLVTAFAYPIDFWKIVFPFSFEEAVTSFSFTNSLWQRKSFRVILIRDIWWAFWWNPWVGMQNSAATLFIYLVS